MSSVDHRFKQLVIRQRSTTAQEFWVRQTNGIETKNPELNKSPPVKQANLATSSINEILVAEVLNRLSIELTQEIIIAN